MSRKALFLFLCVALVALVLAYGLYIKFESQAPVATFTPAAPEVLGRSAQFNIQVTEAGQGLKSVRLELVQGTKRHVLFEQAWPGKYLVLGSDVDKVDIPVDIQAKKLGFADGPAKLVLSARDYAWRQSFHGNTLALERKLIIDTTPPRISVVPQPIYLRAGGCGLALYQVDEDVVTGVKVDDRFFQATPVSTGSSLVQCLFAVPYDVDKNVRVMITARDKAGNETLAGLNYNIRTRSYRHSKINISKSFLARIIPKFRNHYPDLPEDDLEAFLFINRTLRARNAAQIAEITSQVSPVRLWDGAFHQLRNSARTASFGDHRTYFHDGKEIDRQVHMGLDLASTSAAPVGAANSGKVVFAGYLGIYGQCVIIDHGQGLFSLYGHMSTLAVTPGTTVSKDDVLGQTGSTGLAGGDHLHFSILCGGVFVNPIEWLDPHWIKNNFTGKLAAATGG